MKLIHMSSAFLFFNVKSSAFPFSSEWRLLKLAYDIFKILTIVIAHSNCFLIYVCLILCSSHFIYI